MKTQLEPSQSTYRLETEGDNGSVYCNDELLFEGERHIASKVFDRYIDGGFYGDEIDELIWTKL